MKNSFYLFVAVFILCISCHKEKKPVVPEEPEPKKEIINTLLSGSNCERFERLIKGYKMEELRSVKQTPDGGYIFCGATQTIAESEYDILVIKTDCFGNTEWMKTITNAYSDYGYDITPISTGGYFVIATVSTDPNYWKMISHKGQFILLDETGNVLSKKTCSTGQSTVLNRTIETADGSFLICGRDDTNGNFILKTDKYGSELWVKFLGYNALYDVAMHQKNYIACGSYLENNKEDVYVIEMNEDGNLIWSQTIQRNTGGIANSITVLNNNEIAISGWYRTSNTTFAGFAMRLNATGKEIWYKLLEGDGIQTPVNIVHTSNDDLVTMSRETGTFTIVKLDFNTGSIVWRVTKPAAPVINDFQLSFDGGFIITGSVLQYQGNMDGYILKTDKNGE